MTPARSTRCSAALRRTSSLALRFAARELRGGLRGFYVFIACIALGVMAISGVGSTASGLADGMAREGRVILGGDLAFSLSLREASREERAFLDGRGRHELPSAFPSLPPLPALRWPHQPQVRLVNQRRAIQRVPRLLPRQL